VVEALNDAEFVVNTGPEDLDHKVEDYSDVLKSAAALSLPMVCANPDQVVIRGSRPVVCAGAIARAYAALGGSVAYRGKPDPAIYRLAAQRLGIENLSRIAVVGDALETDVKGAAAAKIPSIWCTGGIHAEELGTAYGRAVDPARAEKLAASQGFAPAAIIPGFYW